MKRVSIPWWARGFKLPVRIVFITLFLELANATPLGAAWVAVNDQASGSGTHPNTTRYHVAGLEDGTGGPLRDLLTGELLPVTLTLTLPQPRSIPDKASPAPGTPLANAFQGLVDFQPPTTENYFMSPIAPAEIRLSGLDPSKRYRIMAGAVFGPNLISRHTLVTLHGAESFREAHSSGVLTHLTTTGLQTNQAALDIGANAGPDRGDVLVWEDIAPQTNGVVTLVCTPYQTFAGYTLTALQIQELGDIAPQILGRPQDQFLQPGQSAGFFVNALGDSLEYQWWFNGEPLPGETNATLTMPNLQRPQSGSDVWVVLQNPFGAVTSDVAKVIVTLPPQTLMPFGNVWRYDASGTDLGDAWRAEDYDDSGWNSGPGPLGREAAILPVPLQTTLTLEAQPTTVYFRTTLVVTQDVSSYKYATTNMIDDGAVFYVNGEEVSRLGMPAGEISYDTTASRTLADATLEVLTWPRGTLRQGTNVLAVEVHNVSPTSSDLVFGMNLVAIDPVPEPLIITQHPQIQLIEYGGTAHFSVMIEGNPTHVQWLRNGEPIMGTTNASLTIANVQPEDMGYYTVQAENTFGSVISHPAPLSLPNSLFKIMEFNHLWKYHAQGVDLGTSWKEPDYNDQEWAVGPGVLARETLLPVAIGTELPLINSQGESIITHYFRTEFTVPEHSAPLILAFTNLIDDGAVFYLDGEEIHRLRLTASDPILYNTLASFGPDRTMEFMQLPYQSLSAGTHHLAVEVHQASPLVNSDVVFGTQLFLLAGDGEPIQIIKQPSDSTLVQGFPARFEVHAFGSQPMHFQWFHNESPLVDQPLPALQLNQVSPEDAGPYHVVISNAYGTVTSDVATLTVTTNYNVNPIITRGPYLQNATTSNMTVRWRTDLFSPLDFRYGTDPDQLTNIVQSLTTTLSTNHAVRLEGLDPATRYYYSIQVPTTNLAVGDDFYFHTLPETNTPVRLWVLGDSGNANDNAASVAEAYRQLAAQEREADLWLMLGDNAYISGTDNEYQRAVFEMYPDLLRKLVLWSTIGNHETYAPDTNGHIAYFDIFDLPSQGEAGGLPSGVENYYSFDVANIHFVCLDSELSDHGTNGPMVQWLEADLQSHTKDWVIAFWHSPPYTKGTHDSDNPLDSGGRMIEMRENFLPILESYGVDLVLCGHSHVYERSYLLDGHYGFSDSLQPGMIKDAGSGRPEGTGAYRKGAPGAPHEGTVYVVAGSGSITWLTPLNHPAMWIGLDRLGSLIIDVAGNRLDVRFLRETGEIDDHFTILKGEGPASFRVANVDQADGFWNLSWKSVAGREYRILAADRLQMPDWAPISDWVRATGATSFGSVPMDSEQAQLYFLIEERVP